MDSLFSDNLNVPPPRPKKRKRATDIPNLLYPTVNDFSAWRMNGQTLSPAGFHSQSVVSMGDARVDLWDQYFHQTPREKLPSWWQVSLWPVRVRKTARFDGSWKLPFMPDTKPVRVNESYWSRLELLCKMTADAGVAMIIHRPPRAPRKSPPTDWWASVAIERLLRWKHVALLGSWGSALDTYSHFRRLSTVSLRDTTTLSKVWQTAVVDRLITLARMEEPPGRLPVPTIVDGLIYFSKKLGFDWVGLRELPDAVHIYGPGTVQVFSNHRNQLLLLCRALRANGIALKSPEGCWSGGWYDAMTGGLLLNLPGRDVRRYKQAVLPTVRTRFTIGLLEQKGSKG